MAIVKVRVKAEAVVNLQTEDYADVWQAKCDEDGDMEEGNDYPPVDVDFAIEQFQENLESSAEDLALALEGNPIDVSKV